jgi:hypothetical protein
MQKFMLGIRPFTLVWRPITAIRKHLGLKLDVIAYLNLIPLATYNDRIALEFKQAFDRATRIQLELLEPTKIMVSGKGVYEKFQQLRGHSHNVRYVEQRNCQDAPAVKEWLDS